MGENTAHSDVEREADELAKKAGKAEQHYDKENSVFTNASMRLITTSAIICPIG